MSRSSLLTIKFGLVAMVALMLIGCAAAPGESGSPLTSGTPQASAPPVASGSPGGGAGTTVSVTLQEFSVLPDVASVPSGDVTFAVTNAGPEEDHEFVVIRTDLAPDALPTGDDGSVDEDGDGVDVIDEVEDLDVGASRDLTVALEPGAYVLLCNIVESGESHYQFGMRTAFTVE